MRFCYVGHKFHKKTRSTVFLLEHLKSLGTVEEYLSSPDEDDASDDALVSKLAASDFDVYVFLQTEYIAERCKSYGLGRFILVPMYDGAVGREGGFWRQFADDLFISFSSTHHEELQRLQCRSAYFQFFPEPLKTKPFNFEEPLRAFFWERLPGREPSLQTVLKLCKQMNIQSLHVHTAPDSGTSAASRLQWPERFTIGDMSVTISRWFPNREDLAPIMNQAHVNFAPRPLEGIGMSFLEAMARGQIVVAPDQPTMNEYIRHQTNGLLYDLTQPSVGQSLSTEKLASISAAAVRTIRVGHDRWRRDQTRLSSLLLDDGRRWSTKDFSSHFRNEIRKKASFRAQNA